MTSTTIARAWSVTRADGMVVGLTDHDQPLHFNGIDFRPDSGMSARAIVQGAGLSVDNSEAAGILSHDAISEPDLIAGRWDGAEVMLWELNWQQPSAGARLIFRGSLGEITRVGSQFKADLRGLSEPLGKAQGRVYHPRCSAQLGDAQCRIDLDDPRFGLNAKVEIAEEGRVFTWKALNTFDDRWFERGVLRVEGGTAKGLSGTIKNDRLDASGARRIELWLPLGAMPETGDAVRLIAGCDKRGPTCRLKFDNYLNFRGFPHLPSEEWLVAPRVER
ncbi:DUF2163 domain-containing protein [Paracoccus pacificus]|uniref:DUF2163 domain-containing protein n=1 Tax=Paracoccus pacificus TaxID=1463598 RepID=A0ABW4R8E1_9RHOB